MKLDPNQFLIFNTLANLLQRLRLPAPQHPLVALVDYQKVDVPLDDAGKCFLLHFYKIAFKTTFKGMVSYGPGRYDFQEGGLAFLAPNQVVKMSANKEEYEGYVLYFHPDLLTGYPLANSILRYGFFSYAVDEALYLSENEKQIIALLFEAIARELDHRTDTFSHDILVSQIELLLHHSNRFYHRQFLTRKLVNHDLIDRMQSYLSHRFSNQTALLTGLPSPKEVAEQLRVSPRYLSDMLRTLTGKTTQQHIHLQLIKKAKELLATPALTTAEVAYQLGFEHPQSFNKLFKQKTALSPAEFRQALANQ